MKKIVISGSSKLQDKVKYWCEYFKDYDILDYPKEASNAELIDVYKRFYTNLENTDIFFLMNEEKNNIKGYIGAASYSELNYVVMLNLLHNKKIDVYILNMPSKEVPCYDEINIWLDNGIIKLYGGKIK